MIEEPSVHALDYLYILRRRKRWLLIPLMLAIATGAVLLQVLPKEYRSTATISVVVPVVLPSYVTSSGPPDNQERLRALSQQLMSSGILARVAQEAGLKDLTGTGTPEQQQERVIGALRRSISVAVPPENVGNVNEPRRLDAFLISYTDEEPERARRVTDILVNVFIEENAKTRTARAEGTAAFIAEQLKGTQARLVTLEGQLRVAKESHMGALPEQTAANLSTLSGLRQQLESNATALRGEMDRLSMVERELQALKAGAGGETRPTHAGPDPDSPEGRVLQLQRALENARTTYTPKHPEVQRLEIDLAAAKQAAAQPRAPDDRLAELQFDPSYRQAVADRETTRLRIRDLQRGQGDLERQIREYQVRVESAPRVEQQLAVMVRDYELERQQYAELSSKLHAATIAENVERKGGGAQFTILYPAQLPTAPVRPVPLVVMLLTVAAGLTIGLGGIVAREYFDRSVRDVRDLKTEFELPVLGEVGRIRVR